VTKKVGTKAIKKQVLTEEIYKNISFNRFVGNILWFDESAIDTWRKVVQNQVLRVKIRHKPGFAYF